MDGALAARSAAIDVVTPVRAGQLISVVEGFERDPHLAVPQIDHVRMALLDALVLADVDAHDHDAVVGVVPNAFGDCAFMSSTTDMASLRFNNLAVMRPAGGVGRVLIACPFACPTAQDPLKSSVTKSAAPRCLPGPGPLVNRL